MFENVGYGHPIPIFENMGYGHSIASRWVLDRPVFRFVLDGTGCRWPINLFVGINFQHKNIIQHSTPEKGRVLEAVKKKTVIEVESSYGFSKILWCLGGKNKCPRGPADPDRLNHPRLPCKNRPVGVDL